MGRADRYTSQFLMEGGIGTSGADGNPALPGGAWLLPLPCTTAHQQGKGSDDAGGPNTFGVDLSIDTRCIFP